MTKTIHKLKPMILILAILIHLFYYISAVKTHALDRFFCSVTQGQDFFAIPNAAKSFITYGSLIGKEHLYIDCCGVNNNVFHPFFTLLIGLPMLLLKPWTAFFIWEIVRLITDIIIFVILIKNYRSKRLFLLATCIFLISSLYYYEIINNQYHFLLNFFTFLLLFQISKKNDSIKSGIFYFLSLLVKPIGIFWSLPLLFGGFFKTLIYGLGLFLVVSLPFYLSGTGRYYFDNIFYNVLKANHADWNIFFVFTRLGLEIGSIKTIKYILAGLIILFSIFKRKKTFTGIILWIFFVLMTHVTSFHYHFSILPVIIPLALLTNNLKSNFLFKISLILLILGPPLYIFQNNQLKFIFLSWVYLGIILILLSNINSIISDAKSN